jgi:hypothetical protein
MRQTSCLFLSSLLCVVLVACKEDDSFLGDHATEIRYDCEETVECLASRGNSLTADPVNDCVEASRSELEGFSDRRRDLWKARFDRCAAFQHCGYYDCTQANTAYSSAHFGQLQHDCSQRITCRNMRGEMLGPEVQNYCLTETSVMLDIADQAQRTAFEARFARCGALQGCQYNDCQ